MKATATTGHSNSTTEALLDSHLHMRILRLFGYSRMSIFPLLRRLACVVSPLRTAALNVAAIIIVCHSGLSVRPGPPPVNGEIFKMPRVTIRILILHWVFPPVDLSLLETARR